VNITLKSVKSLITAASLFALAGATQGAMVFDQTFSTGLANGGSIPDNDPSGWSDTRTVSGLGSGLSITDVQVGLNITGGWNGDLYGYLRYEPSGGGPGTILVLLDRVGQPGVTGGYGDTGFSVILSDAGAHAIENYQSYTYTTSGSGQVQGTWQANDGSATFGGAGGTFTGLDPNGSWSLFFADRSGLDQSTVVNWSLTINAVPEPTTWAMIGFGSVFAGTGAVRWWLRRSASPTQINS
jgi:subtilisin-like proprotein convertase family protein